MSLPATVVPPRSLLPKEASDRVALAFLVLATHGVGVFELLVILPYIDRDRGFAFWAHAACGAVIYFHVYASLYWLATVDSSVRGVQLPPTQPAGWFYCGTCTVNTPPRSMHCHICDVCVLRRDHHCMFSGGCVGHANQRYFFSMLVALVIGAVYCNYLNMDYTLELLGGVSFASMLTVILPLLAWSVGLAGRETFVISLVASTCLVGLFLFAAMLAYHMRNVLRAQTCVELSRGVRDYDRGWRANLEAVFGTRWYIAWLTPLVPSALPGNGVEFEKKYRYENIKDM